MGVQTRKSRKQARRLIPVPVPRPRIAKRRLAVGKAKHPIPWKGKVRRSFIVPPIFPRIAERRAAVGKQRHPLPWKGRAKRWMFSIREIREPWCVCVGEVYTDGPSGDGIDVVVVGQVYTDGQQGSENSAIGQIYVDGADAGQAGCDC